MKRPDRPQGSKASRGPKGFGRPLKYGQPMEPHVIRFPRDLWAELVELVPQGQRAAVIHQALRRELQRLRRQMEKASEQTGE